MRLIIAEKDEAARAIASALGMEERRAVVAGHAVTYYEGEEGWVVAAKGHLYEPYPRGLRRARLEDLPITSLAYVLRGREAEARVKLIKELAEGADRVVVATDWDRGGDRHRP